MTSINEFHNKLLNTAYRGEDIDIESYYVQRAEEKVDDRVEEIKQALRLEEIPGCYLFSGHRGAGKTTELLRLTNELNDSGIAAFYCNLANYLDINDPKKAQTELIFSALAGLSSAVKAKYGENVLQESIWERINDMLQTSVTLTPKLAMPGSESGVGIEFSLQENESFKRELIQFAEKSSQFNQEVQDFADILCELIQKQSGKQKIVLILDSLERLSTPLGQEQTLFNSLKELFFDHPERLTLPGISMIYTVPPYIEVVLPNVSKDYTAMFYLHNFTVINKPEADKQATKNAAGTAKMVDIVDRRYGEWHNYISRDVLEHLAWLSGGHVRRYLALICQLLRKAELAGTHFPVSDLRSDALRRAISEEARPLKWLIAEDRRWLDLIRQSSGEFTKHIENLEDDLPSIMRLFDHSLVLNYQNGEIWYQAPPIVYDHL